jgi:CubicO group peptidase (beta-lactamase class C family)
LSLARRRLSAEDKIRIVLDGLRGEYSIAELCRREGIAESVLYSSTNTIILGRILEKVTGQSFGALIDERLLVPLALKRTKLDTDGKLDPPFSHGYTDFCPNRSRLTDTSY